MEVKKNPKSNLENFSKLFIQLGLVLALFFIYISIEHKTYDRVVADLGVASLSGEEEEIMVVTQRIQPVKPPPPPPPPPSPDIIEVVENETEVEETVIETTETDEEEAVEVEEIIEIDEGEEVIEDVPFSIIEDVPVYPGCEKEKGRQAKAACFGKRVSKHVNRKFNTDLASDLGMSAGVKRIFVQFRINEKGEISDVQVRAPHPRLAQEAERVVKTLPKMTPGKQRGRPVGMKYALPIAFQVE